MKAETYIKEGINTYASLSPRDQQWVNTALRKSPPDERGCALLAGVLKGATTGGLRPTVFLSHSHTDKAFARSLAGRLRECLIDVWLDEAELRVGDSLLGSLMNSIEKVDFVLIVLSPASIRSQWVREEFNAAMSRQIAERRIGVLPLLKKKCRIPSFLRDRVYADFTTPYRRSKNFPFLVDSILTHHLRGQTPGKRVAG